MALRALLAAIMWLCLASQPSHAEAGPRRRKLINLQTATTKYFHQAELSPPVSQPLVNCLNYTSATMAPSVAPPCCTLTALECAARCDSTPGCMGFKFMNTPTTSVQTPIAAPPGQQWTWCMLMSWFEISSCSAELRWDPSANNTQVRPSDIFDMYYRYATNSTPQAGTWTIFYNSWSAATAQNATANATAAGGTYKLPVVVGLSVGLGAPLALALAVALPLLLLLLLRKRLPGAGRAPGVLDPSRKHDVFLSYRRMELQIADQVHDKLKLAGLRVFFDRSGSMAGKPFERELFNAIRDTPIFAPIITLADMQRLVAHDVTQPDFALAEVIIALHYWRAGRVRLIFPLLVGEAVDRPSSGTGSGGGERDYLFSNAQFKAARGALPVVVPTATIELVAGMFKAAGGGEALHPTLAAATVRDLVLGASTDGSMHAKAPAGAGSQSNDASGAADDELVAITVQDGGHAARLRGILEMDAVVLYGPDEQAGLVLRHRYAESMVAALKGGAAPSANRGHAMASLATSRE